MKPTEFNLEEILSAESLAELKANQYFDPDCACRPIWKEQMESVFIARQDDCQIHGFGKVSDHHLISIAEASALRTQAGSPLSPHIIREAAKRGEIVAVVRSKAISVEKESVLAYKHTMKSGMHLKGRPIGAKDKEKRKARKYHKVQNKT